MADTATEPFIQLRQTPFGEKFLSGAFDASLKVTDELTKSDFGLQLHMVLSVLYRNMTHTLFPKPSVDRDGLFEQLEGLVETVAEFFLETLIPFLIPESLLDTEAESLRLRWEHFRHAIPSDIDLLMLEHDMRCNRLRVDYEAAAGRICEGLGEMIRELFMPIGYDIELRPYYTFRTNWTQQMLPLWSRYRGGLLRIGQIKLIRISLESSLREMRDLIEELREPAAAAGGGAFLSELQLQPLLFAFHNLKIMHGGLLANQVFRSERLERLLLEYLSEDDVNLEVFREVNTRTFEYTSLAYDYGGFAFFLLNI
ncbi:hypothetical protein BJ508DRAFT_33257 [Ascobolus immersus RN42]|uniref:Uncharacterized protein n=1 Tax=Ascobolus immersus RN42 TaxID=1160509 RepID=A0A3N4HLK6_ASCIM|nr:hypothetical protein BJ508DRAFT_33257 [Ascobolus immersus RN42]